MKWKRFIKLHECRKYCRDCGEVVYGMFQVESGKHKGRRGENWQDVAAWGFYVYVCLTVDRAFRTAVSTTKER